MEKFKFNQVFYSIDEFNIISLLFTGISNDKNLFFNGYNFCFTSEVFENMIKLENFYFKDDSLEIVKIVKRWLDSEIFILFSNNSIIYICSRPFGYGDDIETVLYIYEKCDSDRENYNSEYNILLRRIEQSQGYEINDV